MSLSLAVSPSFCSLRISSGLLYGLRASRCVTLSLSGRSCTSPTFFLFEAKARFFGLDTAAPVLMLLRRGREECRGLVRPASAGAGARTVTFLPVREQETQHQKRHCYIKTKNIFKEDLADVNMSLRVASIIKMLSYFVLRSLLLLSKWCL